MLGTKTRFFSSQQKLLLINFTCKSTPHCLDNAGVIWRGLMCLSLSTTQQFITTGDFGIEECLEKKTHRKINILSKELGMIPVRNAKGANVQDFVVNDEVLLPVLKAFTHCICSLEALRNICSLQSVCSSSTACHFCQQQFTISLCKREISRTVPDTPIAPQYDIFVYGV